MVHQHRFDIVGSKETIEVAASACHSNDMPQFNLGACEIDSGVNMSVQAIGMIQ
jgi:hypothetical protein